MKKGCIITAIVTAILILSLVVYSFQSGGLLGDTSPTHITGHTLGVHGSIEFYSVNDPLSVSCIQVRKKHNINPDNFNGTITYEDQEEYILENYENYDNMVGYCLQGDSLTVFLRKGYWLGKHSSNFVECDTFKLNINDVKYKIK
jgi:hypothetical protein